MLTHKSHFSRFLIWWKSSLFNATLSLPKICLLYACYVYYFSLPNYFDSLFLQDYHKSVAETAVVGFPHPVKGEGRFLSISVWHSLEIVNWPKFYFQFKRMLRFQVPTNVMDWLNFFFLHPGEVDLILVASCDRNLGRGGGGEDLNGNHRPLNLKELTSFSANCSWASYLYHLA